MIYDDADMVGELRSIATRRIMMKWSIDYRAFRLVLRISDLGVRFVGTTAHV
jgi:hypothetical protein